MTYSTDIDALSPDHRWAFDGDFLDAVGSANATSGVSFTGLPLCRDAVNSAVTTAVTSTIIIPDTADIDNETSQRMMAGWFMTTAIQQPPVRIYGEGDSTTSFAMIMGFGNALTFEIDGANDTLQIAGDVSLVPNRLYHLAFGFDSVGGSIRAYLDGIEQLDSVDTVMTGTLNARTVGEMGDPNVTVSLGGLVIVLVAPVDGHYNQWVSWSGANSVALTTSQIRTELFEKGALPEVTITDQAGLDALSDTIRGNTPLSILVNVVGSISLTADNVTFNPLASIHIQYNGTGTLTWTNTNGADASIGSVTGGGTISFVNPATLTVAGVINGAEVRIYDNEVVNLGSHDTELGGIESNIGTSFNYNHSGVANDIIIQMMVDGFVEIKVLHTLDDSDQLVTLFPKVETND